MDEFPRSRPLRIPVMEKTLSWVRESVRKLYEKYGYNEFSSEDVYEALKDVNTPQEPQVLLYHYGITTRTGSRKRKEVGIWATYILKKEAVKELLGNDLSVI